MMVIQIVLIVMLLTIGFNFIGSRNSSRTKAVKKILLLLIIPASIVAILFPSATTEIANAVGVGRGADLMIYGLVVIVIFQAFDGYIKGKQEQRRIALIVRKLALLEASAEPHNKMNIK